MPFFRRSFCSRRTPEPVPPITPLLDRSRTLRLGASHHSSFHSGTGRRGTRCRRGQPYHCHHRRHAQCTSAGKHRGAGPRQMRPDLLHQAVEIEALSKHQVIQNLRSLTHAVSHRARPGVLAGDPARALVRTHAGRPAPLGGQRSQQHDLAANA